MQAESKVHIWYIYHSGFIIQTDSHYFVFDYYLNQPPTLNSSSGFEPPFLHRDTKDVMVFVSHGHEDHFNPLIFEWKKSNENIQYVLSHDIEWEREHHDITIVHPHQTYRINGVEVEVFDSTDIGVSFLTTCNGLTIFHAGDLNWWHWEEDPEEENQEMAKAYKKEIDKLQKKDINLAFIPVDPRLGDYYSLGIQYFMERVGANKVFPMHFGDDDSIFKRLRDDLPAPYLEHIVEITPGKEPFTYGS